MNVALWKKSFQESRALLLFACLIMYGFCWLRVWIVGFIPMIKFQTILEQFREFEKFLGNVQLNQLFTYEGRVSLTYEELIVIMCVAVWSIARGSDAVSGELGRGTMEMLLAQPVSRAQILGAQLGVTIVGLIVLCLACWLGIYTGIQLTTVERPIPTVGGLSMLLTDLPTVRVPLAEYVSPSSFIGSTINLFSLGVFLAGCSTLVSAFDRYRWRTIGIISGFFALAIITKVAALSTEDLHWLKPFSFLSAYEPLYIATIAVQDPTHLWSVWHVAGEHAGPGPLGFDLILLGLGSTAYVLAFVVFSRRDLPAPV